MLLKKNILILVEEKKKYCDSEFLSYNLMLISGKKFRASRYKKNKYLICLDFFMTTKDVVGQMLV
jgi:hypothetical protein